MTTKFTLVFATGNLNKIKEIKAILPDQIHIKSLKEIGFEQDIPEDHDTLRDNAIQKAETIYNQFNINCFAEDTGLEVEALGGKPGVYSARYAGPQRNDEDNMDKLLNELDGKANRKARFRTVFALILDGKRYCFEGIVNGQILFERIGQQGFGYDPLFQPMGYRRSFAQLSLAEKGKISHRARALKKLTDFLQNQINPNSSLGG